jgi:DNA-binding transcriptional MerR regulator
MRVATQLTGLSADTLRVWERRHAAIVPERTDGQARRYTEGDVQRLLLLRAAVDAGNAIGTIAALSNDELAAIARPAARPADVELESKLQAYWKAASVFDSPRAADLLGAIARTVPPRELVLDVLAPLLREVGLRWHTGTLSIATEHAITQQVRTLVGTSTAAQPIPPGAPRIVLAAPEGHAHDIGLALGGLLAALRGITPISLGADAPVTEIGAAATRSRADVVLVACARDVDAAEARALKRRLSTLATHHELWLGLPPRHALRSVKNARLIGSLRDFDSALAARLPSAIPGRVPQS